MDKKNKKLLQGFTLVEILLAMFIFTIIMTIISVGINMAVRAEEQIDRVSEQLAQIQLAEAIMTRDISQIVNRPIINESAQLLPALRANPNDNLLLEFTRAGVVNPQGRARRSTLVRVAYVREDDKLVRRTWRVLDRAPQSVPDDRVLLTGIEDITFQWLVAQEFVSASESIDPLPRAIRFEIRFNHKIMTRIIALPGGIL